MFSPHMKKNHRWTEAELELLSEAVAEHGLNWRLIHEKHFPYLTPNILKNKYYIQFFKKGFKTVKPPVLDGDQIEMLALIIGLNQM